jgi:hypothetical protein
VVYAGERIYGTIGPSRAMATPGGRLYLASHGKLHVFGPDGMRGESIDLASLGVPRRPSDFEIHRDGRLLIADPDESVLHRCTLPSGPCERLDVGLKSVPGQKVLPLNAAKIHIDDAGERYYVSDNSGHSVVIADFSGRILGRSAERTVWYPNQLALVAPGRLSVVDTNNRRVATFDVSADRVGALLATMSTHADDVARPFRQWPFDSVRLPNGETGVLIARERMRDADLVLFDARGTARKRVDLGAESDPFDIELWRGRVWIADATNYTFESVAIDGSDRREIEDRAFRDELAAARAGAQDWKAIRLAAQVAAGIVPLLGIALLWRLGLLGRQAAARPQDAMSQGAMSVLRIVIALALVALAFGIGWRIFRLL